MQIIKKMIYYGLEKLVSLSKNELRSLSEELTLPFGSEMSKYNLVINFSNDMIKKGDDTADIILALIEI